MAKGTGPDFQELFQEKMRELSNLIKVPEVPDSTDPLQAKKNEEAEKKALDDAARSAVADHRITRHMRSRFSVVTFIFVVAWMTLIFGLLIVAGLGTLLGHPFHLSDKVLITAIGSTTFNVLALLLTVLKDLFPGKEQAVGGK